MRRSGGHTVGADIKDLLAYIFSLLNKYFQRVHFMPALFLSSVTCKYTKQAKVAVFMWDSLIGQ